MDGNEIPKKLQLQLQLQLQEKQDIYFTPNIGGFILFLYASPLVFIPY